MGKRKRRLHSPKYATKYAGVRKTYDRLRGVVHEALADGVVTDEEQERIEQAKQELVSAMALEQAVEQTAERVVEQAVEQIVEQVSQEIVEEVTEEEIVASVPPVVEKKKKTAPKRKSTRTPLRKKKTEG